MVDLVLVVVLIMVMIAIIQNKIGEYNPMERNSTNSLRGFFAMIIILFHLSQQITSGMLFKVMGEMGYLAVAIFFCLSGYGLLTQFINTGGGEFDGVSSAENF